jgi:hypothetical protein
VIDQHSYQDQQQREHRDEGGIREGRDEDGAVVIAEPFDDPENQSDRSVTLLRFIRLAERPLDAIH